MTETGWGHVAEWYDTHLDGADTYHAKVVTPHLMRLVGEGAGKKALDIACGQGYFTRALVERGFETTGADIAEELIASAKKAGPVHAKYVVAPAEKMPFLNGEFDVATCVLALQNIKNLHGACEEASRVLKVGGTYIVVLNHPAFRIPKQSAWGWDDAHKVQFRRLDRYLSESHVEIDMHPGSDKKEHTLSYHRPLQVYVKAFSKAGFAITGMEEWNSHRESEKGPRKDAEDRARKEFPLFLCVVAKKM